MYDTKKVTEAIKKIAQESEINLLEISVGEADHVHMLLQVSPKKPMSTIVAILKAKSSSQLKEMPEWKGWSKGFYIATVGTNDLTAVESYIRKQ